MNRSPSLGRFVCALAVGVVALSSVNAKADVVFGNLGVSGTNNVGNFNADIGDGAIPLLNAAQGFTAASPNLTVTSVALWLFGEVGVSTTVGIYSDNAGAPGSLLHTSSSVSVGTKALYQFGFSGANLSNGVGYWIVPQTAGEISWYLASGSPTQQNSSGYSFIGARENSGSGWIEAESTDFAVSVTAVPEPSTYALAAAGLGLAGLMRVRRRRAAV